MFKRTFTFFMAGFLFYSGLFMFFQDLMGLEKYIEFSRRAWVHMSPVWGALLAIGAIVIYVSAYLNSKHKGFIDDTTHVKKLFINVKADTVIQIPRGESHDVTIN